VTAQQNKSKMVSEGIELYFVLLDAYDPSATLDLCEATLSRDETSRAEGFVLECQRRQYIFAHGLLRLALSDCVPEIEPSHWCFAADRYGRSFITAPAMARNAYFSLSHTEGCVACVVSNCESVGVDVERVQERGALWDVVQSAFSADEIKALRGLPPGAFVDRFFDYWTLKEAYLKARGRGFSLALDQFSILMTSDQIALKSTPGMNDDAARWHFTKMSPSANHRLAIADGSGAVGGLPIVVRHWPLARMI